MLQSFLRTNNDTRGRFLLLAIYSLNTRGVTENNDLTIYIFSKFTRTHARSNVHQPHTYIHRRSMSGLWCLISECLEKQFYSQSQIVKEKDLVHDLTTTLNQAHKKYLSFCNTTKSIVSTYKNEVPPHHHHCPCCYQHRHRRKRSPKELAWASSSLFCE